MANYTITEHGGLKGGEVCRFCGDYYYPIPGAKSGRGECGCIASRTNKPI
jgi:hypothetical protein